MCSGWTSEQTALLIELYQSEKELFNVKFPEYHNKFARQNALTKILSGLVTAKPDITVPQIKAKINALRSRYTNELGKIRYKPSGSGTEDAPKPIFEFFEKLSFLSHHVQARKEKLNVPLSGIHAIEFCSTIGEAGPSTSFIESEDVADLPDNWAQAVENSENEANESEEMHDTQISSPAIPAASEGGRKRKRFSNVSETFLQSAGIAPEKLCSSSSPVTDEWSDFGMFVQNSLRNFKSCNVQVKCKHTILKIIMECEEEL